MAVCGVVPPVAIDVSCRYSGWSVQALWRDHYCTDQPSSWRPYHSVPRYKNRLHVIFSMQNELILGYVVVQSIHRSIYQPDQWASQASKRASVPSSVPLTKKPVNQSTSSAKSVQPTKGNKPRQPRPVHFFCFRVQLFRALQSPEYIHSLTRSPEVNVTSGVGGGLDELMRHVPAVRPQCIKALVASLKEVGDGDDFLYNIVHLVPCMVYPGSGLV